MRPTKFEWLIAFALFFFLFASWKFLDTTAIVGYEVDFADAIVHGDFANFYQRAYDRTVEYETHHTNSFRMMPFYDLPVNFVLGLWGIPLYLLGGTEYDGNFWKLLYGKSFFLLMFIVSAFMVYKLCRELDIDENKSRWGAFIYFTSTMAWHSICLIGNIDTICTILTLFGILAYMRNRHRECFLWFMLAFPFKQLSAFIYLPLLLIRDKNLFKVALRLITIATVNVICNIPAMNCPGVLPYKAKFLSGMLYRLVEHTIPLLNSKVSSFVILYGLFCYFCWTYSEPKDERGHKTTTLFIALASMALTLSSIRTNAQWWLYLAPYLAAAAVYYGKCTEKILLFETVGFLSHLLYNFAFNAWRYYPNTASGMLLDMLLGNKKVVIPPKLTAILNSTEKSLWTGKVIVELVEHGLQSLFGGVYILCIIVIVLWLCRPQNISTDRKINMHPYAMTRLLLNAAGCYLPLAFFVYTTL